MNSRICLRFKNLCEWTNRLHWFRRDIFVIRGKGARLRIDEPLISVNPDEGLKDLDLDFS